MANPYCVSNLNPIWHCFRPEINCICLPLSGRSPLCDLTSVETYLNPFIRLAELLCSATIEFKVDPALNYVLADLIPEFHSISSQTTVGIWLRLRPIKDNLPVDPRTLEGVPLSWQISSKRRTAVRRHNRSNLQHV